MKKSVRLLVLILTLVLGACGGQDAATPAAEVPAATEAAPTDVPPTEAPPTAAAPVEASPSAEAPPTEAPADMGTTVETMDHEVDPRLVNVTWEWVRRDPNGSASPEIIVENPENYALFFNEDGTFAAKLDCNNGAGIYATPTQGSILMELGPMTMAACPPGSHADNMAAMFGGAVGSYRLEEVDQVLVMVWAAGGPLDYYRRTDAVVEGEEEVQSIPKDAIQLDVTGLATSYAWEVLPGNPIPPGPGGQGFPPHILLTFDGTTAEDAVLNNLQRMYIFPTEAYVNLYQAAGNQSVADQVIRLGQLITTADGRTQPPENPMPLLPPPNTIMERWAQYSDLNFGSGEGVRYVSDSPYRQQLGVWTNDSSGYYYQGLSTDQTFYVSLFWPVATAALPNTFEDASPELQEFASNPQTNAAYMQETINTLNGLAPSDWLPDLSLLDNMAASLTFPLPGQAADEAGADDEAAAETAEGDEVDLVAPETDEPTAVVTAPDGVFVRSGPGTEYPDIAVAPTGDTGLITGVSKDGQWWVIEVPVSVAEDQRGWVSASWVEAINAANVPVIDAPDVNAAAPSLTGANWQWLSTTTPAETISASDPTRYTVQFNADNTATILADCNNVGASYTADGSAMTITLGPTTLAFCGEQSLDQQYLAGLGSAAIYFFQDGDLYIDLAADAGTMRFTAGDAAVPAPDPTPAPETATSPVQGVLLSLVSFGPEGAEQTLIAGTQITATFSDQSVSGTSGCNDYTGQLTPVNDYFTVGAIASTQKLCVEPAGIMEQEQAYLTALAGTAGYDWQQDAVNGNIVTGGRLFYSLADGTTGYLNYIAQ